MLVNCNIFDMNKLFNQTTSIKWFKLLKNMFYGSDFIDFCSFNCDKYCLSNIALLSRKSWLRPKSIGALE